jgi:hypothetical protein
MKTIIKVERGDRVMGDYESISVVYRKTLSGMRYTVKFHIAEIANYETLEDALDHFETLKTAKGY